jgi:hypothetical protein
MEDMTQSARNALRLASPRYWRWRKHLHGLKLDPSHLNQPVEPPSERDFIICGVPRSGTTLVSAVLHQPPDVVTVMEPWDGMRMPPAELFRSLREEIMATEQVTRGKLDVSARDQRGDVLWRREGQPVSVIADDDLLLGVKWPAFWRYLELLPETKFVVCLRHPYEVIGSFARVGGRLGQGLDYDIAFNREMNRHLLTATDDAGVRRILLHDYIASRILPHLPRPNVLPLRYERWFSNPAGQLQELARFLAIDLSETIVSIRRPATDASLHPHQKALIRERCATATVLGYEL